MNKRIQSLAEQAQGTKKHVPPVWQFYDSELESYTESILQTIYNLIGDEKLSNHYLHEEEANDSLDRVKSRIHDYFYTDNH